MAERVLNNLQKGLVDNIVSTAAGLENGSSYYTPYLALPYYGQSPSYLPIYLGKNSKYTE